MSETEEPKQASKPDKLSPDNVLDSIFRDDGPMPPAKLGIRFLAFVMDAVLLLLISNFIILKYAWPAAYPEAYTTYIAWFDSLATSLTSGAPLEPMDPQIIEAFNYANSIQLVVFWVYFAIGEAFFSGASLGKRMFRLRTVSMISLGNPSLFTAVFRAGAKAITVLSFFPILLIASLVTMRFNKRRQMGHDLLNRTVVVDEKRMQQQNGA